MEVLQIFGSRNWFMIHKSRTLNSYAVYVAKLSAFYPNLCWDIENRPQMSCSFC